MAIEIHIENHDDYDQFIGRGAFELDAFLKFLDDVLLRAKELDAVRVMVDIRELEGRMSTFERFQVGERFARQQSTLAHEVQVVVVGAEPLDAKGRFGETVARNRGANGRVFTDEEEALRWLLRDHPPN